LLLCLAVVFFFFHDSAPTVIYTLSLHDALPISEALAVGEKFGLQQQTLLDIVEASTGQSWNSSNVAGPHIVERQYGDLPRWTSRSEEHTSELQSRFDLVCRLLLEKKKKNNMRT